MTDKLPKLEEVEGEKEEGSEKVTKKIILGTFVINGVPIDDKTEFFVDVSHVFGVFQTSELPKKKIEYKVRWLLLKADIPKEQLEKLPKKVGEKEVNLEGERVLFEFKKEYDPAQDEALKKLPNRKHFALLFDLNNRLRYLPLGDYKVEVYLDQKFQMEKEFKLIRRRGLYLGTRYNKFGITYPTTSFNGHVHTVWGMFHFDSMRTLEKIKSGRVEWIKLDESGEEEKVVFEYPIEVKEGQKFNVFRFRLPKQKPGPFQPSKYLCIVYVNGEERDRKTFEIKVAQPRLFLGTKIDQKTLDMMDDKVVFEGKTRIVWGIYKFCKKISKSNVGKVRWLFEQPLGMPKLVTPKKIAEHPIKVKNDFDIMIFQLNLQKFMALPGLYSCEVYLNDDLQQKRHFRLLPRYDVMLGKMENNTIKKRQNHYLEGTSEVRGVFKSNIVFPEGSTVQILWVAVKVEGMKPNTLLSNSSEKMKAKFSSCTFVCAFKDPFPLGVYQSRILINKQTVAIEGFKVLNKEQFLQFQERKKKLTEMFVKQLREYQRARVQARQRQQLAQQMRGGSSFMGGTPNSGMNNLLSPSMGGGQGSMGNVSGGGGGISTGGGSSSKFMGKTFEDDDEKDYDI